MKTDADGVYALDELIWRTCATRELRPADLREGTDTLIGGVVDDLFGHIDLLPELPGAYYDFRELGRMLSDDACIDADRDSIFTPAATDDLWPAVSQGDETDAPTAAFFSELLEGTCQIASAGVPAVSNDFGTLSTSITVDMLGSDLPACPEYDFATVQSEEPAALAPSTDTLVPTAGPDDAPSDFGPVPTAPEPSSSAHGESEADGFDDDFAETQPAALRGVIWVADAELEGDPGSFSVVGKSGVAVTLTGTDDRGWPISRATKSDAEGRYEFERLYPGVYSVQVATPRGFRSVAAHPGTTGGTPQARKQIDRIRLTPGDEGSDYEFYYEGTGQVAGRVAGRFGPTRRTIGMGGVVVVLTGNARDGREVGRTTTTDEKGKYLFHALPPGTFRVEVKAEPDEKTWAQSPAQVNGRAAGVPAEDAVAVEGITLGADGRATGLDFTASDRE